MLPWHNRTILETVITAVQDSGCSELVIVANPLTAAFVKNLNVHFVINEKFENGMTSSIQAGITELSDADAYMICPGDLPLITVEEYRRVMQEFRKAWKEDPEVIALPLYQGKKGHPVIFSAHHRDEILAHDQPEGCSGIVRSNIAHVRKVEMESENGTADIDTREDYDGNL